MRQEKVRKMVRLDLRLDAVLGECKRRRLVMLNFSFVHVLHTKAYHNSGIVHCGSLPVSFLLLLPMMTKLTEHVNGQVSLQKLLCTSLNTRKAHVVAFNELDFFIPRFLFNRLNRRHRLFRITREDKDMCLFLGHG